jgi:hypothetical protein
MSKKTINKKATRKVFTLLSIIVPAAGVATFEAPTLTVDNALFVLSVAILFVATLNMIKD